MATQPQFGATAFIAHNTVNTLTANTARDGTGTVTFIQTNTGGTSADLVAPAGGMFVDMIVIVPLGTNTATVMRVFWNNSSPNTTAANNEICGEVTCPATTLSEIAAQPPVILIVKKWVPSGTKLFYTLGTAVAAGFGITVYGSDM